MRLDRDQRIYNDFLLRVGNATQETNDEIGEDFLRLPDEIIVENLEELKNSIFLNVGERYLDDGYLMEEASYLH